ncbi:Uncharacterized protein Adt_39261 [Abeliophyllum distichum]|uniref:Uncharacterized protein n=1 Tax=Abeliophyllum distichum TaxID=126358 RepID=A0ABD1Q4M3_9LAMI
MADLTNNSSTQPPTSGSNSTVPPLIGGNHFTLFGVNLSQTPSVKLDKENCLLWRNMILPIIRGHNLECYLLGTKLCPLETIATQITSEAGATATVELSPNLEFNSGNQLITYLWDGYFQL